MENAHSASAKSQRPKLSDVNDTFLLKPDMSRTNLTRSVQGFDQNGDATDINVVEERPLTIFLNNQEIVTAMTIGDYPEYLALGFLKNQGMLDADENVFGIDYDEESETAVVRTDGQPRYEEK